MLKLREPAAYSEYQHSSLASSCHGLPFGLTYQELRRDCPNFNNTGEGRFTRAIRTHLGHSVSMRAFLPRKPPYTTTLFTFLLSLSSRHIHKTIGAFAP